MFGFSVKQIAAAWQVWHPVISLSLTDGLSFIFTSTDILSKIHLTFLPFLSWCLVSVISSASWDKSSGRKSWGGGGIWNKWLKVRILHRWKYAPLWCSSCAGYVLLQPLLWVFGQSPQAVSTFPLVRHAFILQNFYGTVWPHLCQLEVSLHVPTFWWWTWGLFFFHFRSKVWNIK